MMIHKWLPAKASFDPKSHRNVLEFLENVKTKTQQPFGFSEQLPVSKPPPMQLFSDCDAAHCRSHMLLFTIE
jgi:hypothetical protein